MTTNYPSSIDTYTDVVDGSTTVLAAHMNNVQDAMNAVQTELGANVAGEYTDLVTRLSITLQEGKNTNTETLAGTKVMVDGDFMLQFLNPDGSDREITLPAEADSNHAYIFLNTGSGGGNLIIKNDGGSTIATVENDEVGYLFSDSSQWKGTNLTGDINDISPTTTKGDILAAESATVLNRVAIGTDGYFLKADSGETPGLKWAQVAPGKHTVFIPSSFMSPATTNPCTAFAQTELTAQRPEIRALSFGGTNKEYAVFELAFPKRWNLGTITFRPRWSTEATDADSAVWGLQAVAIPDGEDMDQAFGTAQEVTDAAQSNANDHLVGDESPAITIANTPGDGDMTFFTVYRDPPGGGDTIAEACTLLGIDIFYTTDAENDN